MKKFFFLLAACVLMSQGVDAKSITANQAKAIAQQFTSTTAKFQSTGSQLVLADVGRGLKGTNDYYVFNRAGGNGFVIVAGDDLSTPILGYSNTGSFDLSKAPEAKIAEEKDKLAKYEAMLAQVKERLGHLKK